MTGEHTALVRLAQATENPQARQAVMDELATISQYAGGDNSAADQMAAAVLARIRSDAIETLGRLAAATDYGAVT